MKRLAVAVLLGCAVLLLSISRPRLPIAAHAGSADDDSWQGTISLVFTAELEERENVPDAGMSRSYKHTSKEAAFSPAFISRRTPTRPGRVPPVRISSFPKL